MPVLTAPITTPKVPVLPDEERESGEVDPTKWEAIARQASRDAQAELHRKGLSYFIGRNGLVIEVLPSGEERVAVPRHE